MRKKLLLGLCALLMLGVTTFAQTTATGKVVDEKGAAISGATVIEKGTKNGTTTSSDGSYSLKVKNGAKIIVSSVGYQENTIAAGSGGKTLLKAISGDIEEVVVTALGIKRDKRNLTYSTQEVKGEQIVATKQDNVVNSLAGKVAGVQISNTTGMPGSSSRIVVRGNTSLLGDNTALFVIDGVPMNNDESGVIDGGNIGSSNAALNQGSTSNRAIDIDPNIIESITVLKGAAASALYGANGSRGVVLITTKNGLKNEKPQISLSSSYGFNNAILAEFQDKYAQGIDGNYIDGNNGGKSSGSWGPLLEGLKVNGEQVKKHDPRKEFFRTGHTFDNNVSISGSSDKSKYLISYSYLKNEGITPGTDFTRNTFFAKFTNQITNNLSATIQFNFINSINNRVSEGNGLTNPLWTVFSAPISWDPFPTTFANGNQRLYRNARNNPYYLLENTGTVSKVNRILPVATFVYSPTSWLSITERIGADIYSDESGYHESKKVVGGVFGNLTGGVSNRTQTYRQINNDIFIDAHKNLTKDLYGSILVGANVLSSNSQNYTQVGKGLSVDNFYNIGNASTFSSTNSSVIQRKVGFYAQANLEYKKMLNLALTGRRDGSSVLSKDNNFYNYGSAALGFIFTEVVPRSNVLSFGKARISISAVGNDAVAPYSLTTPYVQANGSINNLNVPLQNQETGSTQNGFLLSSVIGNPILKNENLKEFEVGLELKFFKNKLSLDVSYFNRKTTDLLTQVPIAFSAGAQVAQLNAGSMQNKGIEILLAGTLIKTKNFNWNTSIAFTKIKNNVLALAEGVDKIQFGGFGGGGGVYAFANQAYGAVYGSNYQRNTEGQVLIDADGFPLIANDNKIIGNVTPDFNLGLSNTLSYKQFVISFVFDWKKGGDVYNLDNHYNWFYGTPKVTEYRGPRVVPGVYESNGKSNTTAISGQEYFRYVSDIDEAVVEDGTYIKLRNLSIAYNFSTDLLRKSPFKSATFSLTGNNLWIYKPNFTGSDPESNISGSGNGQGVVNYITPTSRSFILGLKLNF